jgi:hypothetical protein
MPATPSSLRYADQIVPHWLRPKSGAINASEAEKYVAAREAAEEKAREYRVAARRLEELTAGRASEAMVEAHKFLAVDHANHADMITKFHKAMVYASDLAQQLDNYLDNIVIQAHQKIAASPPEARDGIIAEAHARAQAAVADFASDITSYHSYVAGLVDPLAATVIGRTQVPTDKDPAIQALSGDGDPKERGEKRTGTGRDAAASAAPGAAPGLVGDPKIRGDKSSVASGTDLTPGGLVGDPRDRGNYSGVPVEPAPVSVPRLPTPPSPLSGGPGGLMSGLQGLGGGELGGGSPLSGFATGSPARLGELGAGAGGVPQSVANAAGQGGALGSPSSAFAKGLEAAGGGGMPYAAPVTSAAPAAPSTAAGGLAVSDAGVPAAGTGASAGPVSAGPGAAQAASSGPVSAPGSGVHVAAGGAVAGGPGSAPMLLPPPPMGPSGPGVAAGEAASAPGGPGTSLASTSSSSTSAQPGGGWGAGAAATAGPTLVPAGVPSPIPVARVGEGRGETPDVSAAKAVVMELLVACKRVGYVGLSWAAGVFRGPAGPPEMVVMSNEGSGYVPQGVFVPSARLLVADPVVDKAFRDRWFGWLDPARVLLEYAKLRAPAEWKLVAAASDSVHVLRDNDVPHAYCDPELADSTAAPGVLDQMHVHRLQLLDPGLYERLIRLEDADPRLQEQVMVPLALMMMEGVRQRDDYPAELAAVWAKLMSRSELSTESWYAFKGTTSRFWLEVGAKRPGYQHVSPDEEAALTACAVYRRCWLVARTLEVVQGWAEPRLPLADMVYAAAAVGTLDVCDSVAQALARVEAEVDRS